MKHFLVALFLVVVGLSTHGQSIYGSLKGQVLSETNDEALPFVHLIISQDGEEIAKTVSTETGDFTFTKLRPGRYTLAASFVGYRPLLLPEIQVDPNANTTVQCRMETMAMDLAEVRILPTVKKNSTVNRMAVNSARMISVDEAKRYAGGFDDPARLVTAFPGVAGGVENNAFSVRGNAPKFVQWKIEGVEVPNPNHFANMSAFGGGGLTAFSSNLLANSDFYAGCFPAEYNNALGAIIDLQLRQGNRTEYQHGFEVGALGIDVFSEGPIQKDKSSYLVNYRYSTLALIPFLLPEEAQGTTFQDLSFKVTNSTKYGTLSAWGIGLLDKSGSKAETDTLAQTYRSQLFNSTALQNMAAGGVTLASRLNTKASLVSSLSATTSGLDFTEESIAEEYAVDAFTSIKNQQTDLIAKSVLNQYWSKDITQKTGVVARVMHYSLNMAQKATDGSEIFALDGKGTTALLTAFSQFEIKSGSIKVLPGVTLQRFLLNGSFTLEPRLGLAYEVNGTHTFSAAYGLHSRLEPIATYLQPYAPNSTNEHLGFSKAHHFAVGYQRPLNDFTHLNVETYYQHLFDLPGATSGTYNLINESANWFVNERLENLGLGRNYGVDITVEQFLHNGFYYMVSGSIFQSQYKQNGSGWLNTSFNRNFLANVLAGKEYFLGENKTKKLGINARVSLFGGNRYSRVLENQSIQANEIVSDDQTPFSEQIQDYPVVHFTASYSWGITTRNTLAIKVLNLTSFQEFKGHRINRTTEKVEMYREALMLPNVSFKMVF